MQRKSSANDWRPSAGLAALRERAAFLARLRAFFAAAGVLEVDTPILSRAATSDPALASLASVWHWAGGDRQLHLHTSPELPMKRLLAAGSGPIYQICKVFRDGERGRLHHPEFTLLEWYRPGWDYRRLMGEVADLVRSALAAPGLEVEEIAYRDLFRERLGLDPWNADEAALAHAAATRGIGGVAGLVLDRDGWLDLLLTHCLEPGLGRGRLTFLYDYPPSQAALARRRDGPVSVAERFELYLEGVELANGFQELTDADEQRRRFLADLEERVAAGLEVPPLDEDFLAALAAGMPEAAGVALGVDRLLMVRLSASHIDEVLAFPIERA
ncbi:lysyl-tRNA synthetase-like protein GenX [Thioflavicoccus mobilis 8321]|uniref:Lysyl-tRNA synthetase-like protein GenX n=1 Tax=Thioflavicoccus mobilis 8321 TaxID=765912 RepID=L0GW44_9GAMM|nr:EF-P lysine aminoacylase EpmA [Thioflavicoccus mobilis]AGA90968.1 lysyl-tRNA synthetase-like protein GenX [Thioflavicoccus mobilis 8321]